ncbi:MAG: efflux RND transporter periplasmic adaptor subunit [Burkholderiaceae bacterium]
MRSRHGLYATGISLALSVLLVGCGEKKVAPALPPLVKIITVSERSDAAPGTTQPAPTEDRLRVVRAELSGEVVEVLTAAGETVRAGQALARINPRDARLADSAAQVQIQAAKAELATAEADFARYTRLRDQSFISQAEWERRQTMLTLARAQYEASLDRLGLYSVRALADARVDQLSVRSGQAIEAGTLLARLTPQRALPQAGPARLPVAAANGTPSAFAQAAGGPLWVPLTAIVDGTTVMVVELRTDGQWETRAQAVTVGQTDGQRIQVREGLHPGEQIVAVGAHLLTTKQIVRVSP